ncbi:hypothetical protein ADUPG1_013840 [Aduncisulcus paluster]|nr:hypothetical protein ADUPG1_013840 [Aduncisulcus paluster]
MDERETIVNLFLSAAPISKISIQFGEFNLELIVRAFEQTLENVAASFLHPEQHIPRIIEYALGNDGPIAMYLAPQLSFQGRRMSSSILPAGAKRPPHVQSPSLGGKVNEMAKTYDILRPVLISQSLRCDEINIPTMSTISLSQASRSHLYPSLRRKTTFLPLVSSFSEERLCELLFDLFIGRVEDAMPHSSLPTPSSTDGGFECIEMCVRSLCEECLSILERLKSSFFYEKSSSFLCIHPLPYFKLVYELGLHMLVKTTQHVQQVVGRIVKDVWMSIEESLKLPSPMIAGESMDGHGAGQSSVDGRIADVADTKPYLVNISSTLLTSIKTINQLATSLGPFLSILTNNDSVRPEFLQEYFTKTAVSNIRVCMDSCVTTWVDIVVASCTQIMNAQSPHVYTTGTSDIVNGVTSHMFKMCKMIHCAAQTACESGGDTRAILLRNLGERVVRMFMDILKQREFGEHIVDILHPDIHAFSKIIKMIGGEFVGVRAGKEGKVLGVFDPFPVEVPPCLTAQTKTVLERIEFIPNLLLVGCENSMSMGSTLPKWKKEEPEEIDLLLSHNITGH